MQASLLKIVSNHKNFLLTACAIALLVRALLFFCFLRHGENYSIYFDSAQYHNLALQIADGQGISKADGTSQFYRLPGYSVFLATCYKFFGSDRLGVQGALIIQLVIASMIPLLVFLLACTLCPANLFVAQLASLITAVHTGFVLYAGMLATESFFVLFFLLFLIFFTRAELCYSGFFLGIASLIRPVGQYLVVLALVFLLLERTARLKKMLVFVTSWFVTVLPWLARNYLLTGAFFFHTLPGLHFLQYLATPVVMANQQCSYVQARAQLLAAWNERVKSYEQAQGKKANDYQQCVLGEQLALEQIKNNTLVSCKHVCTQIFKTCFSLYSAQMLFSDSGCWPDCDRESCWEKIKRFVFPDVKTWWLKLIVFYEILMNVLLLLGFIVFLFHLFSNTRLACYVLPFMALLVFLTLAYGCARLRLPLEPLLILVASFGWLSILGRA
jgi:hypothetical protein